MTTIDPATITQVRGTPVLPVTPQPVRIVVDAATTERRDRGDSRRESRNGGAGFRTVLDAATFAGIGKAAVGTTTDTATATAARVYATTILRTPSRTEELNGQETMDLYRAARAFAVEKRERAAQTDDAQEAPSRQVPVGDSLRAATRYAQSFFSVGGTFAARGEKLELST